MIDERTQDAAPDLREATARPGRTLTRRSGLPTGRAVVGALLVTLAVVGLAVAFQRAQEGPDTDYLVVANRVQAGTTLTESDLATRTMELPDDVSTFVVTDPSEAIGAITLETLLPGQLLQTQALLDPGSEAEATAFEVSISIDRARALGGSIREGDRVDILTTVQDAGANCTGVVASNARVIDVSGGQAADGLTSIGNDLIVTLAMPDSADVLGTVFGADQADITIVRTTRAGDSTITGLFCDRDIAGDDG